MWACPNFFFYCCDTGQPKKRKEMDWAFPFFFWKHPPNRSSQKKKKERKTGVCLGETKKKKHGSLFPKVSLSFQGEEKRVLLKLQKTLPGFSFCFSCVVWTSSSFVVFFLLLQLLRFVAGHFSTSACSWNSVSQRDLLSTYLYIYLLLYKFSWIN